ncbi:MAG: hypothetical protein R3208_20230 [Ketobacteraceae bacterium]|nr:hypothetical protein [Ketobacteraceae bacterium]
MPTRDQLATKYPAVTDSGVPENKNIMCPFLRMIEKTGLYDSNDDDSVLSQATVISGTTEFGCDSVFCTGLASTTGNKQGLQGDIDIEDLANVPDISHECGLTFAFGSKQVDDAIREDTLDRLFELADAEGNLSYDDLLSVKLAICAEQGVSITPLGEGEVKLIFAFLGGVDRGFVSFSDVDAFLHARLPGTITSKRISASLLNSIGD